MYDSMGTIKFMVLLLFATFAQACSKKEAKDHSPKDDDLAVLDAKDVQKTNSMGLWAHYMPWFEDKASSGTGNWGMHWTMANRNPDLLNADGKRQIAAHYYPLIGPYASNDRDVLEYHFLLMKYAGIDGIWIDWYGTRDLHDYPLNLRNTEVIVDVVKKVGLKYAIVYEDQTLRDDLTTDGQRMAQAIADMRYMQSHFFNDEAYFRQDGKPVLLTFGPQILTSPSTWSMVLGSIPVKPVFYTLYRHSERAHNEAHPNTAGEFLWVDATSMEDKYAHRPAGGTLLGGAYPGFHDYYREGGWGDQVLSPIAHGQGDLFEQLLAMAAAKNVAHLQLITWNDFGEGTMIEPTEEFGFTFLKTLQRFSGVSYDQKALESIWQYYKLKKTYAQDPVKQRQLLQAFYYYIALQEDKAMAIINTLKK